MTHDIRKIFGERKNGVEEIKIRMIEKEKDGCKKVVKVKVIRDGKSYDPCEGFLSKR